MTLPLFLNSYVTSRSNLSPEEISAFFEMQNIFKDGEGKLKFAKFRELFFPHMTLAGEDPIIEKSFYDVRTAEEKANLLEGM